MVRLTAMLEDLRRPMIAGDQDVGKRLVVAQQHVEPWPQPLDQVGLKQQRLGLGRGRDEFERSGRRDHAFDTRVVTGGAGVGDDALADVLGLADVEHLAIAIDHAVDARRGRRQLGMVGDDGTADGERPRAGREVDRALLLRQRLLLVVLDELGARIDVLLGSVHAVKVKSCPAADHGGLRSISSVGLCPRLGFVPTPRGTIRGRRGPSKKVFLFSHQVSRCLASLGASQRDTLRTQVRTIA
jgi:hypothetical protein